MTTLRFTAALLPLLAIGAFAQAPQKEPFQTPGLLINADGTGQRAWILSATKALIEFRETAVATETEKARIADFQSIFLYEPREFAEAMDLYQARKYAEAKAKFIEVKERYKSVYSLENSPAALAAFYELECLRKLGDLDGLTAALQNFDKDPLTRDTQMRQLELYVMWDAARAKNWESLDKLARERAETRLPGDQRAQVAYCQGMALEGLQKPDEAILAYQTAMTADAGASEVVARQAALRVMAIRNEDEEVRKAMRDWDKPAANKNSPGFAKLTEAAVVAGLYEMTLGAGAPLPTEFQELLKYRPKEEPEQVPVKKTEEKPVAKPEAKEEAKPAKPQPPKKPDTKKKADPKKKPEKK